MTEPHSFKDLLNDRFAAALKDIEVQDLGGDGTATTGEPLTAQKLGMYLPVTCCMLTDSTGENHCKHPLPEQKPRPWTWRLYDWWWDLRERAGRRTAGWRWPEDAE